MKGVILSLFLIGLIGCSTYETEQMQSFLADPHYGKYVEKLDALEKKHLDGTMSYSEYLEQKKQVDDTYAKEVQQREHIILGQ